MVEVGRRGGAINNQSGRFQEEKIMVID